MTRQSHRSKSLIALCAFILTIVLSVRADAGLSNSLMDVSVDGKLLACSNRDSGTVTVVNVESLEVAREFAVGGHPEGVSFVGQSHTIAVAVYSDDVVLLINADNGGVVGKIAVFDEPYGVVSDAAGERVYVTLDYPGQVVEIDVKSKKVTRTFSAGKFTRGIALATGKSRLFVSEYYTAGVNAIDLKSGKLVGTVDAASTDNLARQITPHPTRPKLYVPHIRSRVQAAHGEGSIFPILSVVDQRPDAKHRRRRIPMDAFFGNLVVANTWEVAIAPDGQQGYVVFAGTDDMFVFNLVDDDYREISPNRRVQVGRNPRAVKVSPDNSTVFVYNALDFQIAAYDRKSMARKGLVTVCKNPLSEEVLQGKVLFYSALQPMVGRRWISCSSCHPDGDADGRTWQNPEGLRNTPPLFGLAWTHPQHWSADRDETQDFEHTIRGQLMQGRGLIRGKVNPSLEKTNKGLSPLLDALAAYTNSHEFKLSPYAKTGLSDSAKRGQALFNSAETKCATCHSGPFFTDSRPENKLVHDVGSGLADVSEKMGPKYDTPMLLGLYRSAPYLHHGKAATLRDVLTTANAGDKHGKTSQLSQQQLDDMVDFLKSLPFEDPAAAAVKAGYTKVDR